MRPSSEDSALLRLKTFASKSKAVLIEVEASALVCRLRGEFTFSLLGFECKDNEGSIIFEMDAIETVKFDEGLADGPSFSESVLDGITGVAFSTVVLQGGITVMLKRVSE